MTTGVIDVGGGLRGIYGSGVLDHCMDKGISFDYCIGVSAGSGNISSFLSGQRGRTFKYYHDYSFKKEYMSLGVYLRSGSYFDLDYIYGTLCASDGDDPLDFDALKANTSRFEIVATDAQSGRPVYFSKDQMTQDNYDIMKASSSVPVVCRPYDIGGVKYYDGGLSDPVPVGRAIEQGCDRVVLILTRPTARPRSKGKDWPLSRLLRKEYPMAAHGLRLRAKRYNESVEYARHLERQGRVLIIAPDDITGVDTTKKNRAALLKLYAKGYGDASRIMGFIKG